MADDKVVTVTLPGGTRVSCREGLAARLAPQAKENSDAEADKPRSSTRRKARTTVARASTDKG